MGVQQEKEYSIVRKAEILQARTRSRDNMDENLANLRSKSRQLCNLFLPTKLKYEEDEIDEDEEKEVDDTSLSKESQFIKRILFKTRK